MISAETLLILVLFQHKMACSAQFIVLLYDDRAEIDTATVWNELIADLTERDILDDIYLVLTCSKLVDITPSNLSK